MDGGAFVTNLLAAGIARGTPLLFASTGEILAERAGVLNLGIEGMMLVGAMAGFAAAHATGNPWLGLGAAAAAAGLVSLVHAFVTVTLKADQVVSGLCLMFLGAGIASVAGAPLVELRESVARLPSFPVPLLRGVPFLGPVFFDQNVIVYAGFVLAPLAWLFVNRTRPGLRLRALGENPAALDTLGIGVTSRRYAYVFAGGCLAGVAGGSLSLAVTPGWIEGMTAGQGWIALGLVIFSRWDPLRAAAGAYLFGAIRRLPLDLQGIPGPFFKNPNLGYFLDMLPYLFTVLVLVVVATRRAARGGKGGAPASLGLPYTRGERE